MTVDSQSCDTSQKGVSTKQFMPSNVALDLILKSKVHENSYSRLHSSITNDPNTYDDSLQYESSYNPFPICLPYKYQCDRSIFNLLPRHTHTRLMNQHPVFVLKKKVSEDKNNERKNIEERVLIYQPSKIHFNHNLLYGQNMDNPNFKISQF